MRVILACLAAFLLCGCQVVNQFQFYDVTAENAPYSVKADGKKSGHGPIKKIKSKNGIRDAGDGMSWAVNLSVF